MTTSLVKSELISIEEVQTSHSNFYFIFLPEAFVFPFCDVCPLYEKAAEAMFHHIFIHSEPRPFLPELGFHGLD